MTRRRSQTKVTQRRQTRAVASGRRPVPAATLRLTVKLVLWAAFFAGLFTLHAHVGLRTAALRAQANELQHRGQELLQERQRLGNEVMALKDIGRIEEIAQSELGMVEPGRTRRLEIAPGAVDEVAEASPLWRSGSGSSAAGDTRSTDWIETLAGLVADLDTTG